MTITTTPDPINEIGDTDDEWLARHGLDVPSVDAAVELISTEMLDRVAAMRQIAARRHARNDELTIR